MRGHYSAKKRFDANDAGEFTQKFGNIFLHEFFFNLSFSALRCRSVFHGSGGTCFPEGFIKASARVFEIRKAIFFWGGEGVGGYCATGGVA